MRRSFLFFPVIALGVIIILVGLGIGTNSNSKNYGHVAKKQIEHYLSDGTTGILQLQNDQTLYIVQENDFSPSLSSTTISSSSLLDGETVALVYLPGTTQAVDVTSTSGTHLIGTAYTVIQVALYKDTGSQLTFNTPTYTQNPHGIDNNYWFPATTVILFGLLFIVGAFFLPQRAPRNDTFTAPTDTPINTIPAERIDLSQYTHPSFYLQSIPSPQPEKTNQLAQPVQPIQPVEPPLPKIEQAEPHEPLQSDNPYA